MAVIEVSESWLRQVAGDEVHEQAARFVDASQVGDLGLRGMVVWGTVGGIPAGARVLADGLEGECECGTAGLCEHAVAVALAWVREGTEEAEPDLLQVLRRQSPEWLARRLAALADGQPALTALLLAEAATGYGEEVAGQLRGYLDQVLGAMADDADEARDAQASWDPDCEDLEDLLDEVEEMVADAPGPAGELARLVIQRVTELLERDDSDGQELAEALAHAEDIRRQARREGRRDGAGR